MPLPTPNGRGGFRSFADGRRRLLNRMPAITKYLFDKSHQTSLAHPVLFF